MDQQLGHSVAHFIHEDGNPNVFGCTKIPVVAGEVVQVGDDSSNMGSVYGRTLH